MAHKFAYWCMFWGPLHITMSSSFLVLDVTQGRDLELIMMWVLNMALALVFLFLVIPPRFMELRGDKPEKEQTSLIMSI